MEYGDPDTESWRPGYGTTATEDIPVPVLFWQVGDCQEKRRLKTTGTTS